MRNLSSKLIRHLRLGALLLVAFFPMHLFATHLVGGELTYQYVSETDQTVRYRIRLDVYRDCAQGTEPFDDPAFISIYDGEGNLRYALINLRFQGETILDRPLNGPCFIDPGDVCVSQTSYSTEVNLPKDPIGGYYHFMYQRCCRNGTINNIIDPLETGQVFDIKLTKEAIERKNNSPSFSALAPQWPPIYVCTNVEIDFDHSAFDQDGDRLVYELNTPYSAATIDQPKPRPGTPYYFDPEDVTQVVWNEPLYGLDNMLGAETPEDRLKIDANSGRLTAMPTIIGQFVVGVKVSEYDRETGELLSVVHRDFQYNVRDCGNVASAFALPEEAGCGLEISFNNLSTNADEYLWYFDYLGHPEWTSMEEFPEFSYPSAGDYQVWLIASQAEQCRDTFMKTITVVENTIEIGFDTLSIPCAENAVLFLEDRSIALESPIVAWEWTVGNGDGTVQTSTEQNPTFFVPEGITDEITLVVTAENGCKRTLTRSYQINRREDPAERIDEFVESCQGTDLFLNPEGDPNDPFTYRWTPGNLVSDSTAVNPKFIGTESAVVTVFIESQDDSRFCSLTKTIEIVINQLPNVDLNPDDVIVCEGENLTLSSGADISQNYTYQWSGPNGFSSSEATPVLSDVGTEVAGTYFVTVTDNVTGCSAETTYEVVVAARPEFTITPVDPATCEVSDGQLVIGGLSAGNTYTVTLFKDGGAGQTLEFTTDANGEIILDNLGVGDYEIIIENGSGCSSAPQFISLENPRVEVSASATEVCEGGNVVLMSVVTGGSGQYAYSWTGPNGFTSSEANPQLDQLTAGQSGEYALIVTDEATGCVSKIKSVQITIFPNLSIVLTPNDPSVCTEDNGGVVIGGLTAGAEYTVSVRKDGGAASTQTATADANGEILLSGLGVGAYEIEVTDENGCSSGPQETTLESPRVVVGASATDLCAGEDLQLTSTVTNGSGNYTYSWTGPDGFTSTEANPQLTGVTAVQSGTYTLVVTDVETNCVSLPKSVEVTITPNPSIVLTPDDPSVCTQDNGGIVIGGLTAGVAYTVSVRKDGGAASTQTATADANGEILLDGLGVGAYEIEVTDENGCSSGPQETTLESPRVEVGASATDLCAGEDLQLTSTVTNGSGNYTYSWTGPDGFTSTEANPQLTGVTAVQSGTYTLVVTDVETNCVSLAKSVDVTITPNPSIVLTPNDPSVCTEDNGGIVIGGLTAGLAYTVSVRKDGGAASTQTATADANGEILLDGLGVGAYEIEVTDENGCSSGPQETTLENPRVEVRASGTDLCEGGDVQLFSAVRGGSGNYAYSWTGPDGFASTEANPQLTDLTTAQGGTYTLVVTDTETNCVSEEKSIEITVNPNPEITLTPNDPSVCTEENGGIVIGGLTAGAEYTISVSKDGVAATTQTATADANGEILLDNLGVGQYTIAVTDANGCSSDPQETSLENPRVEVSASGTELCAGEDVQLFSTVTGGSGNYAYSWTGPDGFTSAEANPQLTDLTPAQGGTYTLIVTDTETNCVSNEKSVEITVYPNPAITLTPVDPTSCAENNGSILIGGLTPGTEYTVSVSQDGGAATTQTATADANGEILLDGLGVGAYEIEVTDENGCSSGPQTISLENPRVEISALATDLCAGEDLELFSTVTGGSGDYTYLWTGPDGFTSTEANPVLTDVTLAQGGTYTLVVTDVATNCVSDEKSIDINVFEDLQITLTPVDPSSCEVEDGGIVIGNLRAGSSYTVTVSKDGGAASTQTLTADANGEITLDGLGVGQYEVEVTDENGCSSGPQTISLENPRVEVSASAPSLCEGDDLTLISTVTGGSGSYAYSWTGPDGFTSSEASPTITGIVPAQAGTYTLVVTDLVTNCVSEPKSVTISVEPKPTFMLVGTDPTTCVDEDGQIVIAGLLADSSYVIQFSKNGAPAETINATADGAGEITLTDLGAGTYQISLAIEGGCESDVMEVILELPEPPTATATANAASLCEGDELRLMADAAGGSGSYTYQWTGPGGFSSTEQNPVIPAVTEANEGGYVVVVTDTETGCVSPEAQVDITVNPNPEIVLNPVDPSTCGGSDGQIVISGLMPGQTYDVTFTDSGVSVELPGLPADDNGEILLPGLSAGTYSISVTSSDGCASNEAQTTLSEPEPPVPTVEVSDPTPCEDDQVNFTVSVAGGMPPYQFSWSGPNGFTSTEQNPQIDAVQLADSGVFTVTVTDAKNCTGTASVSIEVLEREDPPMLEATPVSTCGGNDGTITILDLEADLTYGVVVNGAAPVDRTADANGQILLDNLPAGTYEIALLGDNGCISEPSSVVVEEPEKPSVNPTAEPSEVCEMETLQLMANISGGTEPYTIRWTGPAGFTSDIANPSVPDMTAAKTGVYTVEVTDANGCTASGSVSVSIKDAPEITVSTSNPTSCGGDDGSITIGGLEPGAVYDVTIGDRTLTDVTADAQGQITETGFTAGNYNITVIGANDCASAQQQASLSDPDAPTVTIIASDRMPCENDELELMVVVGGGAEPYTIIWSGPNGFPPTTSRDTLIAVVTKDNEGAYSVAVTDANNCVAAANLNIRVREQLEITAEGTGPTTCGGEDGTITIGGLQPDSTYQIAVSGQSFAGTADENGTVVIDGWSAGSYDITVEGLNGCSSPTAMVSLSDPESPTVVIMASDTSLCVGDLLSLTAQISGGTEPYTISWSGPNGFTSDIQNPQIEDVETADAGVYIINVTDANGCMASANVDIEVNENPVVMITPDLDTICVAQDITLNTNISGGTPGYQINWYELPDDTSPFGSTPSVTVMPGVGQTSYLVEVLDTNGCAAVDTAVVNFFPIDAMLNPMDTVLCDPVDELILSVNNKDPMQVLTYVWMPDGAIITDPADGPVVSVDPMVADAFTVMLENQYGCRDTLSTTVTVSTLRDELDISIEPTKIAPGQSVTITVSGCDECTYSWSPNTGDTGPVVTVSPEETTTYTVIVTDPNGCEYELSVMAMVVPCDEENFFVPSAFTPNGDRINDMLCVRSLLEVNPEAVEMRFIIYNRWGEKVFESTSLNDCWDGTYRGEPLPPDSYGWYLEIDCPEGGFTKSGNVLLLR